MTKQKQAYSITSSPLSIYSNICPIEDEQLSECAQHEKNGGMCGAKDATLDGLHITRR